MLDVPFHESLATDMTSLSFDCLLSAKVTLEWHPSGEIHFQPRIYLNAGVLRTLSQRTNGSKGRFCVRPHHRAHLLERLGDREADNANVVTEVALVVSSPTPELAGGKLYSHYGTSTDLSYKLVAMSKCVQPRSNGTVYVGIRRRGSDPPGWFQVFCPATWISGNAAKST